MLTAAIMASAAGRWLWTRLRRVAARRLRAGAQQSETRRSYVFGGISRQSFDAAIRNVRRRRSRNRAA